MSAWFLLRRLAGALAVMVFVSFITFFLLDLAPGDAAEGLAGEFASEEQLHQLRQDMGLDRPLVLRYFDYLWNALLHGDLGRSLISGRSVSEMVMERFHYTLLLTFAAMVLALLAGTAMGWLATIRPGGLLDLLVMGTAAAGLSLPTFWVALMFILLFSLRLGWLPVTGAGSPAHLILPSLSLAIPTAGVVARLIRSGILDVKGMDYVRTAYAKGLPAGKIWRDHIFRNSLIPAITMLGLHLGHLLEGTVVIETVFGWPGLGRLLVQAVLDRDFTLVAGVVLLIAFIYQALNLLVDAAYAILDPRVGYQAV